MTRLRYLPLQKPVFNGSAILLYLGAFTILFSSYGLFAAVAQDHGSAASFGWSLLFLAAVLVLAAGFYFGRAAVSGGLLAFVAAAFTPVWMVSLEKWAGYWSLGHHPFHTSFSGSWFLLELVTTLVALVLLLVARFPLVGLPLAIAFWYLVTDTASSIFLSSSSSSDTQAWLILIIGLIILGIAVFVDETQVRLASFWLHLVGLSAFAGGLVDLWHRTDRGWVGILVVSVGAIVVSVLLSRAVYGVFGAIGVLYSVIHFVNKWLTSGFNVSLGGASHSTDWKPWFVYSLVGLALMLLGIAAAFLSRLRPPVTATLEAPQPVRTPPPPAVETSTETSAAVGDEPGEAIVTHEDAVAAPAADESQVATADDVVATTSEPVVVEPEVPETTADEPAEPTEPPAE